MVRRRSRPPTSPDAPSRVTPSSIPAVSQYVLVKRAKLWEAASHEHLFFWGTPRLTTGELDDLVGCVTGEGLSLVRPAPDHMTTYSVARHRRRCRRRSRVGARAAHTLPQELRARLAGMGRSAPGGGRLVARARDDQFTGKTAGGNAPGQCVHRRRRCCARLLVAATRAMQRVTPFATPCAMGIGLTRPPRRFRKDREGRACDGARPLFEAQGEKRGSTL